MKAEIYEHGPISCGIQSTPGFHDYQGGIYSEFIEDPQINHEISVVGWGKDQTSGKEYWIARNSWGTYWGEHGFFRVAIGDKRLNLGIQLDCSAGLPSFVQAPSAVGFSKVKKQTEFIQY